MVLLEILMVIAAILIIGVMVLAVIVGLSTFTGHDRFKDVDVDAPERTARVRAALDREGQGRI